MWGRALRSDAEGCVEGAPRTQLGEAAKRRAKSVIIDLLHRFPSSTQQSLEAPPRFVGTGHLGAEVRTSSSRSVCPRPGPILRQVPGTRIPGGSQPAIRHWARDGWKRAGPAARLGPGKGRGWHSLRSLFSTDRIHQPLKVLHDLAGPEDPRMVLLRYQHPTKVSFERRWRTVPAPPNDRHEQRELGPSENEEAPLEAVTSSGAISSVSGPRWT